MRFFIIICICFLHIYTLQGQTSYTELQPPLGSYNVGFTHYTTVDSTRTYTRWKDYSNAIHHRPILVSIWYPANGTNKSEPLYIKDYLNIVAEEEEWEGLPEHYLLEWFSYLPSTLENEQHLNIKTNAHQDAPAVNGKFPVVIYAPGLHRSSIENFVMCEYLASQGYVVIASPSRGTEIRTFQGSTSKNLETQARDILFLIKEAQIMEQVDAEKIATMGFSFGGLSNVLAQMQNEHIDATICLDGSVKYQYDTLKQSPFFDLNKVDVPFIHMAQKEIPKEVLETDNIDPSLNTDFLFYDEITKSDAYKLQFNELTHLNFNSLSILFEHRDKRQDSSDVQIMSSYQLLTTYVLNFLNAYLKKDAQALAYLQESPESKSASVGHISVEMKKALPVVFDFNDFHDMAIAQDYNHLKALHKKVLSEHPLVEIPEGKLNYIGLQLAYHKDLEASIRLYKFAVYLYPTSGNLYDSLAETYMLQGDTKNAITSFKKSLTLDPENENAILKLKTLE